LKILNAKASIANIADKVENGRQESMRKLAQVYGVLLKQFTPLSLWSEPLQEFSHVGNQTVDVKMKKDVRGVCSNNPAVS
jgi:hypothetical protein